VKGKVKKVVLAYSGGLDTSVVLKWLHDTYGCEVVTFTADIGQGEELEPARKKARRLGVKEIFVDDLREEFTRDFVFPMFRANAIYEGEYLLGTSIARPLIAKRQIEIARRTGADAVAHGATGKGNDQVRFELGYYALEPNIRVIAPWREWNLTSREKLLEYAEKHGIPIEGRKKSGSPYSMDANLLHISYEGRMLEDPSREPEEDMWLWTVSPEKAPNRAEVIELSRREEPVGLLETAHGAVRIERTFHQSFRIPFAPPVGLEEIAAVDVERPGQARDGIGHRMNDVVTEHLGVADRQRLGTGSLHLSGNTRDTAPKDVVFAPGINADHRRHLMIVRHHRHHGSPDDVEHRQLARLIQLVKSGALRFTKRRDDGCWFGDRTRDDFSQIFLRLV